MAKKEGAGINPLFRNMLKGFIPMLKGKLDEIDPFVKDLLQNQQLQDDEDSAKVILQYTKAGAMIIIAAFRGDTVVRIIETKKLSEFISEMLNKI